MIKEGELLVFSGGRNEIRCRVHEISKESGQLFVVDDANALAQGKKYVMTATQKTGIALGEGMVASVAAFKEEEQRKDPALKGKVIYTIKIVTPFKKRQNRNHCRHDCVMPIAILKLGENASTNVGNLTNISAGGFKAVTNAYFAPQEDIILNITLNKERLALPGVILGLEKLDIARCNYKYSVRAKFVHITRKDEEAIVRFIFSEYRKIPRKN